MRREGGGGSVSPPLNATLAILTRPRRSGDERARKGVVKELWFEAEMP